METFDASAWVERVMPDVQIEPWQREILVNLPTGKLTLSPRDVVPYDDRGMELGGWEASLTIVDEIDDAPSLCESTWRVADGNAVRPNWRDEVTKYRQHRCGRPAGECAGRHRCRYCGGYGGAE